MKNLSVKKWSLLGLTLIAASAVTAAILPSSKDQKMTESPTFTQSDDGAAATVTCSLTNNVEGGACDISQTATSVNGGASEDAPGSNTSAA
jgi:hypothetical protein